MEIRKVKIELLNPAPYNPRKELKPGDPEYEQIKKSIEEFDLVEPLVWNQASGNLVGGHQRLNVLKEKGFTEVDVSVVNIPDLNKEKALNIALNKIAGEFDDDKLALILNEIKLDFDLTDLGFTSDELLRDFKIGGEGLTDPDDVPEVPKKTNVKRGDVYQLGNHRLMCGDSTDEKDVAKLMGGEKANLTFTSPPYWVGKGYETQKNEKEIDEFVKLSSIQIVSAMHDDSSRLIINTGTANGRQFTGNVETILIIDKWVSELRKLNWLLRHLRIWVKTGSLPAKIAPYTDLIDQHCEFIGTFYNPNGKKRGQNKIGFPWVHQGYFDNLHGKSNEYGHCASFPEELSNRFIRLYSLENEIVLDPFGGAGTTIISCDKMKRKCRMMEINPLYCQVIIDRWQIFSGKKAVKL